MQRLTYKQAFDLITEAYIKGEIQPFDMEFCFCGTLSPDSHWDISEGSEYRPYSYNEYEQMERALFSTFPGTKHLKCGHVRYPGTVPFYKKSLGEKYEDILFAGMCAALEVLKQIHIGRGEIIDETPAFTKRQLPATV